VLQAVLLLLDLWNMRKLRLFILTGQSLASGAEGNPALSTTPLAGHWMLGNNVGSSAGREGNTPIDAGAVITPYLEPVQESIVGGFARMMKVLQPAEEFAYLYCGIGGESLTAMNKGTAPYSKSLQQIRAFDNFAKAQGMTLEATIIMINGENDSYFYNTSPKNTFRNLIRRYWADMSADFAAITGNASPIKMLLSQTSAHGFYHLLGLRAAASPPVPSFPSASIEQADLANDEPDKFVMVSAKYDLPYASANSVHLNNVGYEQHGQKIAEVYNSIFFQGKSWRPLQLIKAAMKDSITMIASFEVPVPPLTWDDSILDPGAKGFSLASGIAITSAKIINGTQIEFGLGAPYLSGNDRLRYAWDNFTQSGLYNPSNYPTNAMGKQFGARGQLQDSDNIAGSSYNQANHCIHCSTTVFGLNTNPQDPFTLRTISGLKTGNLRQLERSGR
jgi:hypothetical protein